MSPENEIPLGEQIRLALRLAGKKDKLPRTQSWLASHLGHTDTIMSLKLSGKVSLTEEDIRKTNQVLNTSFVLPAKRKKVKQEKANVDGDANTGKAHTLQDGIHIDAGIVDNRNGKDQPYIVVQDMKLTTKKPKTA